MSADIEVRNVRVLTLAAVETVHSPDSSEGALGLVFRERPTIEDIGPVRERRGRIIAMPHLPCRVRASVNCSAGTAKEAEV